MSHLQNSLGVAAIISSLAAILSGVAGLVLTLVIQNRRTQQSDGEIIELIKARITSPPFSVALAATQRLAADLEQIASDVNNQDDVIAVKPRLQSAFSEIEHIENAFEEEIARFATVEAAVSGVKIRYSSPPWLPILGQYLDDSKRELRNVRKQYARLRSSMKQLSDRIESQSSSGTDKH